MSEHNIGPLAGADLFLEPAAGPLTEAPTPTTHHPGPKPADHMCTCGKVREACVHDEIRALWSGINEPSHQKDLGKP
jgi:hypothetical protein